MKQEKLLEILKADLNSILSKDISIEDCNKITLNLWNLSNKDYEQCLLVLKSLKSKTNKVQSFKPISENFLKKLTSNNYGPWSQPNVRQSNPEPSKQKQSYLNVKNKSLELRKKLTLKVILWTLCRLFFALLFFTYVINSFYEKSEEYMIAFSFTNIKFSIRIILPLLIGLFIGYVCLRAAFENSNVWTRKTVNNLRKWDFSYWKK